MADDISVNERRRCSPLFINILLLSSQQCEQLSFCQKRRIFSCTRDRSNLGMQEKSLIIHPNGGGSFYFLCAATGSNNDEQ